MNRCPGGDGDMYPQAGDRIKHRADSVRQAPSLHQGQRRLNSASASEELGAVGLEFNAEPLSFLLSYATT